jgi:hypothetical protein
MIVDLLHPIYVSGLDLLDQTDTVVGVNHFLTDFECHVIDPLDWVNLGMMELWIANTSKSLRDFRLRP